MDNLRTVSAAERLGVKINFSYIAEVWVSVLPKALLLPPSPICRLADHNCLFSLRLDKESLHGVEAIHGFLTRLSTTSLSPFVSISLPRNPF